VGDVLVQHNLPRPQGLRRLAPESRPAVNALAQAIATEVDRLMAVRWSRTEGAILEVEPAPAAGVSTAACACGSGIPVTTVQVDGRAVQIMALEPILELAYNQGLRADGALPGQIMETVRLYNAVPAGEEALYEQAVKLARRWTSRPRLMPTATPGCSPRRTPSWPRPIRV
jgi:hypothetical protein